MVGSVHPTILAGERYLSVLVRDPSYLDFNFRFKTSGEKLDFHIYFENN
jgi:hypothetical protein